MTRRTLMGWALAGSTMAAIIPDTVEAQERRRSTQGIPPGHLPPPGECRVWFDDRPPGQQPPPTDCTTARREAARTRGRVIYGGSERRDRRDDRECDEKDRRRGECDRDDRDRDRYPDRYPDCDYPRSLPEMIWGVMVGRGERLDDVKPWLGSQRLRARYTDANRDGTPEVVTWVDTRGRIVQRWTDADRDGRADRVAIYENGRVVRVIE